MIMNLQVEGAKKAYPNRYCALRETKKLKEEGKEVKIPCFLNIKTVDKDKVITVALEDGREFGSIYIPKYIDLNEYEKELKEIYEDKSKIESIKKYQEHFNKIYLENKEDFDFLNNILKTDMLPNYTAYIYDYVAQETFLRDCICVEFE